MDPPEDFSAPRVRSLGNPDNGEEIHDGHSRKVVAITGASSGIGEATALLLAERGATLVLARGDSKILLHQRGARTTNTPLLDERVPNLRADCLIRTAEDTPKAEGFAAAPKTPPLCQRTRIGLTQIVISRTVRRWALHHRSDLSLTELAAMHNPCIRGWIGYYGHFYKEELVAFGAHDTSRASGLGLRVLYFTALAHLLRPRFAATKPGELRAEINAALTVDGPAIVDRLALTCQIF